ncbi:MAG: FCD domain-containing protein [Deltaproteobacteria bacterium]
MLHEKQLFESQIANILELAFPKRQRRFWNLVRIHALIYELSGNPLLSRTAESHWRFLRRAMGEILRRAKLPNEIWRQHAEIVDAIASGDEDLSFELMIEHDLGAAIKLGAVLKTSVAESVIP